VIKLRMGRPGRLPPPRPGTRWSGMERAVLDQVLSCSAIGSVATVRKWLAEFVARTGIDEVIIAAQIFDHAARLRSYELAAQALSGAPRATSGMATAG
jgi:alkanesulfonate monooxygenase SsuD/methylene tetrahydromethanopterin reductase-like flavin-dependent oxidoreductase (luciferase family)